MIFKMENVTFVPAQTNFKGGGMMTGGSLIIPENYNAVSFFVDRHLAEGRGDKTAIYYLDQKISYREVAENVNKTGNAFLNLGIETEDRILLLLLDCPEFVYSFFGAIKIGAVPIPTNTMLKPTDYEYLLKDSRAKAIVVSEELIENINEISSNLPSVEHIIVVGRSGPGQLSFHNLIKNASPVLSLAPTIKDDPCFWLYSSGTTGFPKGAVHLQHDMVYCAENYAQKVLNINEDDVTFSVAKLFFAYGLGNGLYFPFSVGAATVLSPQRPLPEHVFEVIERYRPTLFFGVPTSYYALLQLAEKENKYDLSSIRLCVSAGEALPEIIYQRWMEEFGLVILDGIGSTEILHIFISNQPGEVKPGSSGRLVPGYEAKILDEDGCEVSTEEQGTLYIKGDSIASYYWNKHEKSKQTFVGEWINTGDRYYRDKDGYFWYMGRGDDMIKSGGIWVSPVEVESTLLQHTAVLECAVTGWADSDGLIKPKAFVVLKQNSHGNQALVEELQQFVKNKIAPYKYPRWLEFIDELPKTATGKIQRYKLRQGG